MSAIDLSLITDRDECRRAFETLKRHFARDAILYPNHFVGWQSNSGRFDVYWHPVLRVWGLFEEEPPSEKRRKRYWNCFGIVDPAKQPMLSITVEINPPHEGEN